MLFCKSKDFTTIAGLRKGTIEHSCLSYCEDAGDAERGQNKWSHFGVWSERFSEVML